jgi:hypothetical protein
VERARVNRRLGKPIQRSLDRMLVAAMQGATWAFNADMVRDWIALQRGAAEDKARITEEILELSSKRHRVG